MILNRPDFKSIAKNIGNYTSAEIKKLLIENNNEFINEYFLRLYIKYIYFDDEIIFNKQFPGTKYRPDIFIKSKNIIFEYDGPTHYTSNKVIVNDKIRDAFFETQNIKVIRIPFFIEFNTDTISELFGQEYLDICSNYPNGFINENVVLPSDFCERGLERFKNNILSYNPEMRQAIYNSLMDKISQYGSEEYVFVDSQEWFHEVCSKSAK